MDRKVLLVSNHNAVTRPWNGVPYEFLNVIAGIEDATIVAPPPLRRDLGLNYSAMEFLRNAGGELADQARRAVRGKFPGVMQPVTIDQDYDVCFFMCQFSKNLGDMEQVKNWRARSKLAVAFVLETWSSQFARRKADLAILNEFDHVFVLNASSIPELKKYVTAPVSFLATGADALASCPHPANAPRVVDILSMGRRRPEVHEAALKLVRDRDIFYIHDIWGNITARDWGEIRAANADMTRRCKYYVAWDPVTVSPIKNDVIGNERAISTRYFEGAAGGAIMIGSRAGCEEFDALFDWPDAVVEIDPEGGDLAAVLEALDADTERAEAARRNNVLNSLRRHDWAFRWERILETLGLETTAAHRARVAEMARLAGEIDVADAS
ncbi:glycosyltransferase family protein [Amaricoccus tamworthensis]|uniref:glycosyltransferase family protein n=1 Tax=Amaricoccus tamworthensis TaxID=57002 RepID=UPI003C7C3F66